MVALVGYPTMEYTVVAVVADNPISLTLVASYVQITLVTELT